MIDGIMFRTFDIGLIAKIHEKLDPDEYVEVKSGKSKYPIEKKKHCLAFKIWYFENGGAKLEIVGSIHKFYNSYFNNTDKNCDDFSFYQLQLALDALENDFKFDLNLLTLVKVEIGFNMLFSIIINVLLSENLHSYYKKKDTKDDILKNDGKLLEYKHGDHLIKMYNKSAESKKHFERNNEEVLLRTEIKTERTRETAKAAGLVNETISADKLRDINVIKSLGYYYLNNVREILILDTFSPPINLSKKECTLFNVCSNIKAYWGQKKTPETKRTQFIKYLNLLKEHELLSLYHELQNKAYAKVTQYIEDGEIYIDKKNAIETENLGFSTTKTINNINNEGINPNESTQENLGFSTTKTINNINNDGINPDESTQENLGFSTGIINVAIFNKVDWVEDTNDNELESDNDSADYQDYYLGMYDEISTFQRNECAEIIQDKNNVGNSTLDKGGIPQFYSNNNNINKIFQFIQPNNNYTAEQIFDTINLERDVEYLELILIEMVNQGYLELHNFRRPYIYFITNSYPF